MTRINSLAVGKKRKEKENGEKEGVRTAAVQLPLSF